MITEDYVSFETAKLLKEKGFDEPCYAYWHEDENRLIFSYSMHAIRNITNPCFFGPAVPTIQMAMKWLRKAHNLFIGIEYVNIAGLGFVYQTTIGKFNDDYMYCLRKKSYEEACEAAVKDCLENLI